MSATALPAWEDLRRDYLDPGLPHRLLVRASPGILVFTDEAAARLGARFELEANAPAAPPSALEQIGVADVTADGRRWLEISTGSPRLYESFYRLIGQVSGSVLADIAPHAALARAVELWDTLVAQTAILSEERQAGLFGELLLLERLLQADVTQAVSAWVGPDRQAHDFRLGSVEFEVKTTSSAKRVHTINGAGQLSPSVGCSLFLVSTQIADAGTGGRTLPALVDDLRGLVPSGDLQAFEAKLEMSAYAERHRAHYARRRRLRSPVVLIPVVDGVPRLTPCALAALPPGFASERIAAVSYDIDVTGLGHADGSPEFLAVIPAEASAA
ncbi:MULTISPECIES: PD-(D/E)XK motif protein [unclassified Brevundimonas]|uniref:PD-(D/E)XK motif protein n=1 Tax=unclassified Brevundimonas TaxID=2622653 RepID=UPI000CFAE36C|nr:MULTISPECIES: PD-(D/E)XK motif protein [unclassified Brevundimonas]PRA27169.1 hypothetical protein CQ024_11735 [Brevundimonas sp. MYb27]PQZ77370.1 hypothetical protein CQ026_13210 [Brevundimonas sp. MYb31]PRB17586.1 hypothetical protein CQ039_00665 [Brevundimonas sp. MYb52]PRB37958.1 hypothetical protein CQ035_00665 [Brevundimonas sp. MYb46]PRB46307.1 hypothetical protein CQ028_11830 [Brevundimonas sp. MYb33]